MLNPEGSFIWYELMSPDPAASKAFYDAVVGWTIAARSTGPEGIDYRTITRSDGGSAGGVLKLDAAMQERGARPAWLGYLSVANVDAAVAAISEQGGKTMMPPYDVPGIGRMAMVTDPQGAPFYVMRGESGESSTAFDRMGMGKCNWNELATTDQTAGNSFYATVFGWTYPDTMPMGEMGDYIFVQAGDQTIGATMTRPAGGPPPSWQFYFRVPDIDAAAAKVTKSGGTVHHGPTDVPGGDRIIISSDPHGAMFGVVARGNQGA